MMKVRLSFEVETAELDSAIEKANRLKELLTEVRLLIDSLSIDDIAKAVDQINESITGTVNAPLII